MQDSADLPLLRSPRTLNVLLLFVTVAAVFSYLCAYAGTNALLKAELLDKWPPGRDPRPRWLLVSFTGILIGCVAIASLLRWSSNRQLKYMDSIEEAV